MSLPNLRRSNLCHPRVNLFMDALGDVFRERCHFVSRWRTERFVKTVLLMARSNRLTPVSRYIAPT
eukprot:scaffold1453_cov195-Amphora_coffeaeformis.AAC.8